VGEESLNRIHRWLRFSEAKSSFEIESDRSDSARIRRFAFESANDRRPLSELADEKPLTACSGASWARMLESVSRPVMSVLGYEEAPRSRALRILTPNSDRLYRYPDMTEVVSGTMRLLETTIREKIPEELRFLRDFDRAKSALSEEFNVPDDRLSVFVSALIGSEGGRLSSKRLRRDFPDIPEPMLRDMETTALRALGIDPEPEEGGPGRRSFRKRRRVTPPAGAHSDASNPVLKISGCSNPVR
jgi:hypothetical protein